MNIIAFSCQDEDALTSWVAAFRLAVWEKARLEEIYTGHLLRMSLSEVAPPNGAPGVAATAGRWKEPRSTLVRGRLEGWIKVRVAGQTEWRRVWAVITARSGAHGHTGSGSNGAGAGDGDSAANGTRPVSPVATLQKRNRMSSFFGVSSSSHQSSSSSTPARPPSPPSPSSNSTQASIALYLSPKPKDRKNAPLLTVTDVTQAFSVYPDRVELINLSTLIKVEGRLGGVEIDDHGSGGSGRGRSGSTTGASGGVVGREGWMFLMPEAENGALPPMEMLKWVVGKFVFQSTGRLVRESERILIDKYRTP